MYSWESWIVEAGFLGSSHPASQSHSQFWARNIRLYTRFDTSLWKANLMYLHLWQATASVNLFALACILSGHYCHHGKVQKCVDSLQTQIEAVPEEIRGQSVGCSQWSTDNLHTIFLQLTRDSVPIPQAYIIESFILWFIIHTWL